MRANRLAIVTFILGMISGIFVMQVTGQVQASARVTGIGGVFFKADDPESLGQWYADNLGIMGAGQGVNFFWRLVDKADHYGMTVWSLFELGSDYFGDRDQDYMINYRVDNLAMLLETLALAGIPEVKPREHYEYGDFAWIEDPEGNRIELWQSSSIDEGLYLQLSQ